MRQSGNQPTYLDCAASSPLEPRVFEVLMRHYAETGNAGSRTHEYGRRARSIVEQARHQVATVVGASRSEVVFTSGATESNNIAILGLERHGRETGKRHVITSAIEHAAVLGPVEQLERRGFEVTRIRPNTLGRVECDAVGAAIRPDTLLVSVMHVNNETGVIQPVDAVAETLRELDIFFHIDAAQGFGRDIERLRNGRIDFISASAHKINGPQGVGALIARRRGRQRAPLSAVQHGGGQEMSLRPGTLPVALIAAFGYAAELAMNERAQREEYCGDYQARLLDALAPLGAMTNGEISNKVSNIVNLSIPGVDAESAMEAWEAIVAVSNGAACSSQAYTCSHVLSAMGLPEDRKAGALRLSWCHLTPDPDYPRMVEAVRAVQGVAAR